MKMMSLFDGRYFISNKGDLYSMRRKKYLKPSTDKYGYLYYVISINGERYTLKAHRLVAKSFIPNPDHKPTVDHINGDKKDNRTENLRWATYAEQQENPVTAARASAARTHIDYKAMGAKRNYGRKAVWVYHSNEEPKKYESLLKAAFVTGCNYSKASECATGKRKQTGGYVFCYE